MPHLVTVEHSGRVATIRLDRADKRNALSSALLGRFQDVVQSLAADTVGTRAVVILGQGPAFCAGADIAEFTEWDAASLQRFLELGSAVFSSIAALPQPVIAGVHGYALGGGLELALACDIRIAASGARFGLPEVGIGGVPGWGASVRLQELIGRGRATHMMLTGDLIGAEEAHAIGLVAEVVDPEVLESRCVDLADRLAEKSSVAISLAKRAIAAGSPYDVDAQAPIEQYANLACMLSEERKKAVESFAAGDRQKVPASTTPNNQEKK